MKRSWPSRRRARSMALRLLHLHDHPRGREDLFGGVHDARAGLGVVGIRKAASDTGRGLDDDLVTVGDGPRERRSASSRHGIPGA